MIALYIVLGYLIIALGVSLLIEHKNKTVIQSNKRIQNILNGGEEAITEFAKEAIDNGLPYDVEWDDVELPPSLVEHTRQELLTKLDNQRPLVHTDREVRFSSLAWPVLIVLTIYVLIIHRPKDGETYLEWVKRVEDKK